MSKPKLYRVSESELFNLQSMYDHLLCQRDVLRLSDTPDADAQLDEVESRIAEVEQLMDKAYCIGALVTWPELSRIRTIQQERREIRYATCIAAGACEADAAIALTM